MTLIIITPGPTLSAYINGKPVVSVTLSPAEALCIIADSAKEIKP